MVLEEATDDARRVLHSKTGHVLYDNGVIFYTPGLYEGNIYVFERTGDDWVLSDTMNGHVFEDEAYVALDPEEYGRDDDRVNFITHSSSGRHVYDFNNESRGLHRSKDGMILHFTLIESETSSPERQFGVEIFEPNGGMMGYSVPSVDGGDVNYPEGYTYQVTDIDSDGQVYMLERYEIPTAVKLRFDWSQN